MRLSAIALFVGGLLQVPATAFDPDLYDPRALFNPAETPAHAVFWIAYLLITMGLPAAYFIHIGKFGWLGTVGFLLALAGSAMTASVSLLDGFALPLIATSHPTEAAPLALVGPGGAAAGLMPALLATAVTFFPGYVMFGIAMARAAVIQAWAGWLLGDGRPAHAHSLCSAGGSHTYHHRLGTSGGCFCHSQPRPLVTPPAITALETTLNRR